MSTLTFSWLTGALQAAPAKRPAPDRFYCLLDEQPDFLVPARFVPVDATETVSLVVNPSCQFLPAGQWPEQIASIPPAFLDTWPTVWLNDPATQVQMPFWYGSRLAAVFSQLQPGAEEPAGLTPSMRSLLRWAGVLRAKEDVAIGRRVWEQKLGLAGEQFKEGWVPLAGLLHPFYLGALRRYYRYLHRKDRLQPRVDGDYRFYSLHNEPVVHFFHHQLTAVVSAVAGRPLKPSYVFSLCYPGGVELPEHCNREQCEYTLALCLDFAPEPELATGWPLHLRTERELVTVYQALGDALLFRGRAISHFRKRLPQHCTSTSILFHYVDSDFAGPLD